MCGLEIESEEELTRFVLLQGGEGGMYKVGDEIGAGVFGVVRKAVRARDGALFAAKLFMKETAKPTLEIELMRQMKHVRRPPDFHSRTHTDTSQDHIVNYEDEIREMIQEGKDRKDGKDRISYTLIMTYVPGGNLLQANETRKISREEMTTVLRQVLGALDYLHDKKITHRDIKPANILLQSRTPNLSIKLCDFGLATDNEHLKTRCGTRLYAAAEVFTGSYDNSVDIWATGVIGLEFLQGLPKYAKDIEARKWSARVYGKIEQICAQTEDPLMSLLKRMLELKPEKRPSAQACLASPSMNVSQSSPRRLGRGSDVFSADSMEELSEQPTEMLTRIPEPLLPPTAEPEGWDRPTTPQGSRKRLRSSNSSARSPVVDDLPTQASTGRRSRMARASRGHTTNLRKVHIVEGQTGRKMIARPSGPLVKHIPLAPADVGEVTLS